VNIPNFRILRIKGYLLILILFVAHGCNSDDSVATRHELEKAKALWSVQKIESYAYTIVYCGFLPHDSLEIAVVQNQIARVVNWAENDTLPEQKNPSFATIDDLFKEIGEKLGELPLGKVGLSFNDSIGYPEEVYYDEGEQGWGYRIVFLRKH
jgi:hypothetical protein